MKELGDMDVNLSVADMDAKNKNSRSGLYTHFERRIWDSPLRYMGPQSWSAHDDNGKITAISGN
jgi:hypothetical protein